MAEPLRVLIVEDSEDDAALVLRELTRGGYEPSSVRVDTAGRGRPDSHGRKTRDSSVSRVPRQHRRHQFC